MLETLLMANLIILLLIFFQLRKNIAKIDSYFAAIDLSLRQFFINLSNSENELENKRHSEILRQLESISKYTTSVASILDKVHNQKSIEEEYYESENASKWLPRARLAREKLEKDKLSGSQS